MKLTSLLILALILLTSSLKDGWAEYRVYQYYVSSKYKRPDEQRPYLVTSTLDPVSYIAYHGGQESIKVDLLRTWPCPGHTGAGKPMCRPALENSELPETEEAP